MSQKSGPRLYWITVKLELKFTFVELAQWKKLIHEENLKKFNNFLNKKFTKVRKVCVRELAGSQSVRSRNVRSRSVCSRSGRFAKCAFTKCAFAKRAYRSVRIEVVSSQSVLVPSVVSYHKFQFYFGYISCNLWPQLVHTHTSRHIKCTSHPFIKHIQSTLHQKTESACQKPPGADSKPAKIIGKKFAGCVNWTSACILIIIQIPFYRNTKIYAYERGVWI